MQKFSKIIIYLTIVYDTTHCIWYHYCIALLPWITDLSSLPHIVSTTRMGNDNSHGLLWHAKKTINSKPLSNHLYAIFRKILLFCCTMIRLNMTCGLTTHHPFCATRKNIRGHHLEFQLSRKKILIQAKVQCQIIY
jgi:hypothetical protein